jgi:hypothetical protein
MPKVEKPRRFGSKARYNPVKGFDALKKEKEEAKNERKRMHMLKVATIRFRLLKANRTTSQLAHAGNKFNEIATQFQNLSLSLVDPETEPANLQVQAQVQVYE